MATQQTFEPREIVIVRWEPKSNAEEGVVAKQRLKPKGSYIVLQRLTPGLYEVHKLLFIEGAGTPGRPQKADTALMKQLPSVLCMHKQTDCADTRLVGFEHPTVVNPLKPNLGVHWFGRYQHAPQPDGPEAQQFAFVRLDEIWSKEVDSSFKEETDGLTGRTGDDEGASARAPQHGALGRQAQPPLPEPNGKTNGQEASNQWSPMALEE